MTYNEYLNCAEKHLKGCTSLLESYNSGQIHDKHVWLELYYLSGYIIEGITIYSAYKLNNWPLNDDIQRSYNLVFSQQTNLDFYYSRVINNVNEKATTIQFFQNRPPGKMSVQGHRFQEIVKNILKPDPSFNDTPYIGNGKIDSDVEKLIDNWSPEIRYLYDNGTMPLPILSQDAIARLIKTCFTIFNKHI